PFRSAIIASPSINSIISIAAKAALRAAKDIEILGNGSGACLARPQGDPFIKKGVLAGQPQQPNCCWQTRSTAPPLECFGSARASPPPTFRFTAAAIVLGRARALVA